jgi:SH3 domain protein
MRKTAILTALLSFSLPVLAERGHIADDVYVFFHGGPSNEYRITGRVNSGEPVEILGRNNSTGYVQIKTESGRTGWVPNQFVATGDSKLVELPKLEQSLQQSLATISEQADTIERLNADLKRLNSENGKYDEQIRSLNSEIRDLQSQIANMDQSNLMRWLTYGGLIAFGGVILGLLIPYLPRTRKRRDDWF